MSLPRSRTHPGAAVVGVADHNGWAVLVSVAAENGEPHVVDRRRVELIRKGVPSQPYHHETLGLGSVEAERLLGRVRKSISACTARAFDRLSADLWPRYRVASIAIRQPPLDGLPASVTDVHRSYHVTCRADGMLYHSAICAAARQRQWDVVAHRRGDELANAARALGASERDVERFVRGFRQTLKTPWTAEHRLACAAAIGHLIRPSNRPGDS